MAYKSNVLVVANRTASSLGLEAALRARAEAAPARFTLLVPAGRDGPAQIAAARIAAHMSDTGLEVTVIAGDRDPLHAVLEVYSPSTFDEIIVSTLPAATSRWMRTGLPQLLERATGALVHHVEAHEGIAPTASLAAARG